MSTAGTEPLSFQLPSKFVNQASCQANLLTTALLGCWSLLSLFAGSLPDIIKHLEVTDLAQFGI